MDKNHKTVTSDADYDVTFHPAFASACIVKPKGGEERELYRQPKDDVVDCTDGHPKRHVVKLKGKGNRRDITITIDDPEHSIHALSLELYEEGRSPMETKNWQAGETFTLLNDAKTCPPHCDPI